MRALTLAISIVSTVSLAGTTCIFLAPSSPSEDTGGGPFDSLPLLAIGEGLQPITADVSRLGLLSAGDVLRIRVIGRTARIAYILRPEATGSKGVIVNGGPVAEDATQDRSFFHRVATDGELLLYVDDPIGATVRVELEIVDMPGFQKPSGQTIVLVFDDRFLVDGVFDPAADSPDDEQFLLSVQPIVRDGVVDRVREIFEGTPVEILGPGQEDEIPSVFSTIRFLGRCKFLNSVDASSPIDVIRVESGNVPPALGSDCPPIGCPPLVVFGEVTSNSSGVDAGNQDPADEAVVYVGSFRAPAGCSDRGFVMDSVNNIINTLSLTGAHEAAHLLGLSHSALEGLMAARPSLAFQRRLLFQRSQLIQFDPLTDTFSVATSVVQDPAIYFENIFSP